MQISEFIRLWNHASAKIMDIRLHTLEPGGSIKGYHFPASAFLIVSRGNAKARLDEKEHRLERFHILHGGCGARLELETEETFEWYCVFYKAVLMLPPSRRFREMAEEKQPFLLQFAFKPHYPLALLDNAAHMFGQWLTFDPLHQFHAKTLFYQFVHELLWQMHRQGIEAARPDRAAQAIRYMREHYKEPITLESLAELLDCSSRQLNKLFRSSVNDSPMRYLTRLRMEAAARLLLQTDMVLHDIAGQAGYPDAYSLSRSFKKTYGMSPAKFKSSYKTGADVPKLTHLHSENAIVAFGSPCYSDKVTENYYHRRRDGGLSVYTARKSASMTAATLLLALTLLLGACSGGNAGNAGVSGSGNAASQPSAQASEPAAEPSGQTSATKTYIDSKGVSVELPVNPERIIDLTGSAIGNLLELGVKPVGATYDSMRSPYHQELLDGVADLGDGSNAEAMLALEPDLIIVYDYLDDAQYETLTQIAPVARLAYGAATPSELLLKFGEIVDKKEAAQAWIEEWNIRIAEVKPEIQAVVGDKTVSILQPYAKGIYAWGNKGGRGGEIIHGDLGLKAPKIIQETLVDGEGFGGNLSLEQLPEYAGDFIFTSNWGWDDGNPDVVYDSNLWKSLPAVKNGKVYFIDEEGSYYNDPISLEAQLDFIVKSLLGE